MNGSRNQIAVGAIHSSPPRPEEAGDIRSSGLHLVLGPDAVRQLDRENENREQSFKPGAHDDRRLVQTPSP